MQSMSMKHGGMDMDMDMDKPACKMDMYWNWYTLNACFISEQWQITSKGMFGGTCVGVVLLVMTVELLRRLQREYDRLIIRKCKDRIKNQSNSEVSSLSHNEKGFAVQTIGFEAAGGAFNFKPTLFQQFIRSLFYMVQLGAGYIIMLLVMYYNGYIFFCILIGGLLGHFLFASDSIAGGLQQESVSSTHCG